MNTLTTPPDAVMPPLPVVAWSEQSSGKVITNKQKLELEQINGTPGKLLAATYNEPLCKVSDAQAYAAQRTAELEAVRAAPRVSHPSNHTKE